MCGPHPSSMDKLKAEPEPAQSRTGFSDARESHLSTLGLEFGSQVHDFFFFLRELILQ